MAEVTLFGPSHLAAIALTVIVPLLLAWWARSASATPVPRTICWVLAIVLILNRIAALNLLWKEGYFTLPNILPMHLCDWATILVIFTLLVPNKRTYELCYFWGLAGTFQAVLTPDIFFDFPHPRFITFFVAHSGVIVGALYLTLGMRFRPEPASVLRAFLWSQLYLLAAFGVNMWLGTNFGYLSEKPINPSLLDHLGPWPYYIVALEFVAALFFSLCYLPFWIGDRVRKRRVKQL